MIALFTAAGLCLVIASYPFLIYRALLRLLPTRPTRPSAELETDGSEFALLFCAYNEISTIRSKLDNLRMLLEHYPRLEVLAYDDCSSDGTAEILSQSDLPIRTILSPSRHGKAHGMQALAQTSSRQYYVFTDANVSLDVQALPRLLSAFSDNRVGGVCGKLQYTSATDPNAVVRATGLYWRLEESLKSEESRTGNVMGADGAVFAIRSELYPRFPDTVLDDLTVSMHVIFSGQRLIKDDGVIGYEDILSDQSKDFRRRIRIAMRAFHTHLWLRAHLATMRRTDRWRYWSHRYIRWFAGLALSIAASFFLAGLVVFSPLLGIITAALGVAAVIAAYRLRLGILSSIVHVGTSMILTSYGAAVAVRGGVRSTWEPPR